MVDPIIFEIVSKLRKKVQLTGVRWSHIILRHKELRDQIEKLMSTLTEPDAVYYSPSEDTYHYIKRFRQTPVSQKHLLLVVKHRGLGEGFIITAFFARTMRTKGKVLVHG